MYYKDNLKKQATSMKSIMEEGSSVFKAIEKGWAKAGNPKEFTVKIYEEAEKNFIGMTTKSAKIGIFFDEFKERKSNNFDNQKHRQPKPAPKIQPQRNAHPAQDHAAKNSNQNQHPNKQNHPKKQLDNSSNSSLKNYFNELESAKSSLNNNTQELNKTSENSFLKETNREPKNFLETNNGPLWTPEMVQEGKNWLMENLGYTQYKDVSFTINPDKYYLKINLQSPICADISKERQLFAALSLLMMQSIKKKFERPFKGFKIILMRNESNSHS